MKIKPILFNTEMVQAILAGRKTQTRRDIKQFNEVVGKNDALDDIYIEAKKELVISVHHEGDDDITLCRYSLPFAEGDIMWVRETWQEVLYWVEHGYDHRSSKYIYKATGEEFKREGSKWKPSIHMPKDACRLFLKVKRVWIEKLKDISKEDARDEGILGNSHSYLDYIHKTLIHENPTYSFKSLWQKINGNGSWDENPYVFCYEFEKTDKPVKF